MQSVLPNVQLAAYGSGDLVTFDIKSDPSKAIVPGSIRLSGSLTVTAAGARIPIPTDVRLNAELGMHAVIADVTTSSGLKGTLETINEYGRALVTLRQGILGQFETSSSSQRAAELCLPDAYSYQDVFYGSDANNYSNEFALAPAICINQTLGPLPFARTGDITVTMMLSQPSRFLHGAGAAACNYSISNLQLTYMTVDVDKEQSKSPVIASAMQNVRKQLASSNISFQTNASLTASRMLGSFILQSDVSNAALDHFRTLNIQIQQLGITYNDGDALVSFLQQGEEEVMMNFLFAMRSSASLHSALASVQGLNSLGTSPVQMGYGIGASFPPLGVDMRKNSLGVTIDGAVVGTGVLGYFVFQGFIMI